MNTNQSHADQNQRFEVRGELRVIALADPNQYAPREAITRRIAIRASDGRAFDGAVRVHRVPRRSRRACRTAQRQ